MASDPTAEVRNRLLRHLQGWLEKPMMILALIWLGLFIYEVIVGLNPVLQGLGYAIWGLFLVEATVGFALAPSKWDYLKGNWLKVLALTAPGLRILRVFPVVRAARVARIVTLARTGRSLRLLRVVSSVNRAMTAFGKSMGRRRFGYVLALTVVVLLVGSAGFYAFERSDRHQEGIQTFADAVWWTAMILTTMGSAYWPQTAEGRVLCFLLSLYAIAVFGYFTAALATYFIGRDAENEEAEVAGREGIESLHSEIRALHRDIERLIHERRH